MGRPPPALGLGPCCFKVRPYQPSDARSLGYARLCVGKLHGFPNTPRSLLNSMAPPRAENLFSEIPKLVFVYLFPLCLPARKQGSQGTLPSTVSGTRRDSVHACGMNTPWQFQVGLTAAGMRGHESHCGDFPQMSSSPTCLTNSGRAVGALRT